MHFRSNLFALTASLLVIFGLLACGPKSTEQPATSTTPGGEGTTAAAPSGTGTAAAPGGKTTRNANPAAPNAPAAPVARAVTLPAGTVIVARLNQALGSKISQSGETFSASVAQPIEVGGKVVVPRGAEATGTVEEAAPLGRFKGGARLKIVLTSVTVNGTQVPVQTAAYSQAKAGKGKRSAGIIGGGAGLGAIIGGLAGGGKGAAIGALAGAGAGTAGAAFTGNKDIVFPAETTVSFKLLRPAEIR